MAGQVSTAEEAREQQRIAAAELHEKLSISEARGDRLGEQLRQSEALASELGTAASQSAARLASSSVLIAGLQCEV